MNFPVEFWLVIFLLVVAVIFAYFYVNRARGRRETEATAAAREPELPASGAPVAYAAPSARTESAQPIDETPATRMPEPDAETAPSPDDTGTRTEEPS
jgi:hypothetical protein